MTAERPFYIYCHTSPSGKRYIGQTSVEPKKRWNNGLGYLGCTYFRHAIEKYGWENIRHDILCVVHSEKLAHLFEQYYIQKYDTFNRNKGYNLTLGGEGTLGHHVSDECKRKISEANTGNFWSEERKKARSESIRGANNGMYGRHHTEESRRKMSEKLKQVVVSPEMREFRTNVLLETNKKRQVAINQYDLDGNLVATYDGFGEMERATGFNHSTVIGVCKGHGETAYGFRWEYADDSLRSQGDAVRKSKPTRGILIRQLDLEGNEIACYKSMSEASRATGLNRNAISECCRGGVESYAGFVWEIDGDNRKKLTGNPVAQLDSDGNEIARYESPSDASAKTGARIARIRACCNGTRKTTIGYGWKYVDDNVANHGGVAVGIVQLDMNGTEISRYKSLSDAERATGFDRHRVADCCKGRIESYKNYQWRYLDAA